MNLGHGKKGGYAYILKTWTWWTNIVETIMAGSNPKVSGWIYISLFKLLERGKTRLDTKYH